MQTFLPYPDFVKTAKLLDRQRLGKQRVEAIQILRALNQESKGWQNHPATKMWQGYEYELALYGLTVSVEFYERGYDGMNMVELFRQFMMKFSAQNTEHYPWWSQIPQFRLSHQSKLISKDPKFYGSL